MARWNRPRNSSLFFLEMIFAILFFSVAGAVCLRLFVKAHLLSADSRLLSSAVCEVSGIAEVISVSGDSDEALSTLSALYPDSRGDSSLWTIYYDAEFCPCSADAAAYAIDIAFSFREQMLTGDIRARSLSDSSLLYSLNVDHYVGRDFYEQK